MKKIVEVDVTFSITMEGTATIEVEVPKSIAEDEDLILEYLAENPPMEQIEKKGDVDPQDLEISEVTILD